MDNFMDKLAQKFNAQEMIKANSEAETNEMRKMKLQVSEYEKILQEMRKLNYKNTEISEKLDLMIGENADKIQAIKEDEQKLMELLRDITDEQTRNLESDHAIRQEDKIEREKERADRERERVARENERTAREAERESERNAREAEREEERTAREAEREKERIERETQRENDRIEREREIESKREDNKLTINELTEFIDNKFQSSDDFAHKENVKVYRNVQAVVVDELKRYNDSVQEEHSSLQKRITAATWIGAIAAVASIGNIIIWIVMILMNSGIIG